MTSRQGMGVGGGTVRFICFIFSSLDDLYGKYQGIVVPQLVG